MTRYYAAAFFSGFSLMVVELTSSRIVAPIIGASVFTWTAVIGVTLLGLSVGSIAGGYLADRYFQKIGSALLSAALAASALLVALIVPLSHGGHAIVQYIPSISSASTALCLLLFLLPAAAIGTVQPIILRLYARGFERVGREYGLLSGLWSLGGIIGVFATGFYFISHIGSSGTLYAVSGTLILLSAQFLGSKKRSAGLLLCAALFVFPVSVFSSDAPANPKVLYDKETDYYHIRVVDYDYFPGSGKDRWLFLDFDSHSVATEHPAGLYTDMAPVFSVFSKLTGHPMGSIHVIGAGAYVLPEHLRIVFPQARISVSEVDPTLVDVGNAYFDLARYDIQTHIGDARMFFAQGADRGAGAYDLIFGDAYDSFISVPWYLMTAEFLNDVDRHVNDGGIYAVNFISSLEGTSSGLFRSAYATMDKTFPDNYVFAFGPSPESIQSITVIGVKGGSPLPYDELRSDIEKAGGPFLSHALVSQDRLDAIKKEVSSVPLLTDDFAPVERLMSPVMDAYFQPYLHVYDQIMK